MHTIDDNVPIIHGDIKPANILLDAAGEPRIGDFGMARYGGADDTDVQVSRVFGTRPYLPPDYCHDRRLNTKVDTYSFGVVLLELATGLPSVHKTLGMLTKRVRQVGAAGWPQMMANVTPSPTAAVGVGGVEGDGFAFDLLMRLGVKCTEADAALRPDMETVMKMLKVADN